MDDEARRAKRGDGARGRDAMRDVRQRAREAAQEAAREVLREARLEREGGEFPMPPWAADRGRRRRRLIDREAVVAKALEIIDAEGTEAVTMRRLALELGVAPSSLYAHVENREELFRLVVHEVMDAMPPMPDTGDWRADLRSYFLEVRRAFLAHRDLATYAFADTGLPTDPDEFRELELVSQRIIAAGVPPRVAFWGFDRLLLYVVADAFEAWRFEQQSANDEVQDWLIAVEGYVKGLPADAYPVLSQHADVVVGGEPEERFLLGLDVFLDGMAAQIGI